MIDIIQISKIYQRGDGTPVTALRGVSFTIQAGEFVTVRGASGSGKSSLLHIIGCLDTPSAGAYQLAGEDGRGSDLHQTRGLRPTSNNSFRRPSPFHRISSATRAIRDSARLVAKQLLPDAGKQ